MSSVRTDLRQGVNSGIAIKVPCRVATTAAVTLSGLQTIDGIALATNDRVLVKDQASAIANGIYIATTSAWQRSLDMNGAFDIARGTLVLVNEGATHGGKWFTVTSSDPITIGTTSISFAAVSGDGTAAALAGALASSSGSSTVGFIHSGTGAVARTVQSKLRDTVSVVDYGADPTGVADSTAEIQAAIDSLSTSGGTVYFPAGIYLTSATLLVDHEFVSLRGAGARASIITFAPTANDTCIEFSNGVALLNHCGMSDLGLFSHDSTYTKIAVDVVDTSCFVMERVYISGSVVASGTQFWSGANSIGIRVRGREAGTISQILVAADRPILVVDNPNSTIDIDHFNFSDLLIFANAHPCVEIDTGVNLTEVKFTGYQAWVLGTYGLYWVDTTTSFSSHGLTLENIRVEQGTLASAYIVRIEHNQQMQGVRIVGGQGGADRYGFRFRKCHNVSIDHFYYTGGSGSEAMNVDATVIGLRLSSCFWQALSSADMTGQRLVWRSPMFPNTGPLPPNAVYDSTANAHTGTTFGGALAHETIQLANAGTVALSSDNGMQGFLVVTANDGVVGTFQVMGANQAVVEISDPQILFSHTAGTTGMTNVYWSTGSSAYTMQNLRGSSFHYKIALLGSYVGF